MLQHSNRNSALFIIILFLLLISSIHCVKTATGPELISDSETGPGSVSVSVSFPNEDEKTKIISSSEYMELLIYAESIDTLFQKRWYFPDSMPAAYSTGPLPARENAVFCVSIHNSMDTGTYSGSDTISIISGKTVTAAIKLAARFGDISLGISIPSDLTGSIGSIEMIAEADHVSPVLKALTINGDSAYGKITGFPACDSIFLSVQVYDLDNEIIYSGSDTLAMESGKVTSLSLQLNLVGGLGSVSITIDDEGSIEGSAYFPGQAPEIQDTGMVLVPGGVFIMGEEGVEVNVSVDSFYIDRFEVTNSQFAEFLNADTAFKEFFTNDTIQIDSTGGVFVSKDGFADHPVTFVNWYAADAFCTWKNKILPSDTMWEKAARGTDGRMYPWGNEEPDSTYLNYNNKYDGTVETGMFEKGRSPYGVYDMAGNVYEWCSTKELSKSNYYRKGGGWNSTTNYCQSSYTGKYLRTTVTKALGFRCALQ
jgi:formylglycine-generating enzyme required for sulfatase activity